MHTRRQVEWWRKANQGPLAALGDSKGPAPSRSRQPCSRVQELPVETPSRNHCTALQSPQRNPPTTSGASGKSFLPFYRVHPAPSATMAGRFVRASKYRGCSPAASATLTILTKAKRPRLWQGHKEGSNRRKICYAATADNAQEHCYDNLRISKNAWDTNLIKVSATSHATSR